MKADFYIKKDILIHCLKEIKGLSINIADKLQDEIEYEIQKLVQNRFNLAVVGQFKRGKSTFINALLKARIVPTAIVPLTSIVTLIKYGERLKITVEFNDGKESQIPLEMLDGYVTEKGNPNNEKGVRQVVVEYPSDFLKDGIILIDTPGVGSVFQHNTDATYEFLPKLDAAIFLFTIDSPVAKNELEFLKEVNKKAVRIFFLLNKVDYAEKQDISEALEFAKGILEKELEKENIKIYSISAKTALEAALENDASGWEKSGIQEFINDLEDFISFEKKDALLESVRMAAKRIISQLKFACDLEMKALTTPLEELDGKISILKEKIQSLEEEEKDILFVFEGETKEVFARFQRDYEDFMNDNYKGLESALEKYFVENMYLSTGELIEKSREYITEETLNVIDDWKNKEIRYLAEISEKITGKLAKKMESIICDLQNLTADIFEIKYEGFRHIKGFKQAGYFYYNMEPEKHFLVPTPLSAAPFLPGFIAKKIVLGHMKKWLQQQFDRQCGRVRYDISQRMEKTFKNYAAYLKDMLMETKQNILTSVEKAADMRRQGETAGRDKVEMLKMISSKIRELEMKVNEIHNLSLP
ncbi:MAG: dynamin family protein [Tepidanaerobacteraceae bacterium]|jgi:small GTP-binding protein|nr:dynamin family protein [Tepidanaerobacteraceae bacterium]